jgi:hypothetical protein
MTTFVFTELVPTEKVLSAALGPNANTKFADADVGKAVKLGSANNYVLVEAGDEIEGFVTSIEPFTVNNGFSFGGVVVSGRVTAEVGANQGATPMAVGDYVVADAPVALGTAGKAQVKTGTPTKFLWRCIRVVSGTGAAGSMVLLERIN